MHTNVTITGATFELTSAKQVGGSLAAFSTPLLDVSDSRFASCAAAIGGAVAAAGVASISMRSSTFWNNSAAAGPGVPDTLEFLGPMAVGYGGSVFINTGAAVLTGLQMSGNSARASGGALHVVSGSLKLAGSSVVDNTAGIAGAGVSVFAAQLAVSVTGTNFSGNAAGKGAAIAVQAAADDVRVGVQDSRFTANNATAADGGAVLLEGPSMAMLTGCLFRNNSARQDGGAVAALQPSALAVNGSSFEGNAASRGSGGGLYCSGDNATVQVAHSCSFTHNRAWISGGGLSVMGADINASISDAVFSGNTAADAMQASKSDAPAAGASVATNCSSRGAGGAACIQTTAAVVLQRLRFSGNTGGSGGRDCWAVWLACGLCSAWCLCLRLRLLHVSVPGAVAAARLQPWLGSHLRLPDGLFVGTDGAFPGGVRIWLAPAPCCTNRNSTSARPTPLPLLLPAGALMLSSCDNATQCPATVTDVSFERNTAVEAAGGAAYAVRASAIQGLSCLLPYTQAASSRQQQHTITSSAPPSSCWASGNAAVGPQAYAPSLATSASSISPNISDGDFVPNGAFLLLAVPIMDAAGNVMTLVGAENETVRATITSVDASPFVNRTLYTGPSTADSAAGGGATRDKGYLEIRGVTTAPVVKGMAVYTTMALSGTPGQRFRMQLALGSGRWAVQPLELSLQMQWCSVGQILAGDSCEACIPGTHNFGGALRCEPGSLCSAHQGLVQEMGLSGRTCVRALASCVHVEMVHVHQFFICSLML